MRQATLAQFQAEPGRFLEEAQDDELLITERGEPVALVVGMRFKDEEDLAYERSPEFWEMIERSRRQPSRRLEEIEAELFAEDPELRAIVEEAERRGATLEDAAELSKKEP